MIGASARETCGDECRDAASVYVSGDSAAYGMVAVTAQPSSPDAVKLIAASCARIGAHFAAISAELEVLDAMGGNQLACLGATEQSHGVEAAQSSPRRKRMISTKRNEEEFLGIAAIVALLDIEVRSFRRLRRDKNAKFPVPHQFGPAQRWKASEVRGWIERQKARA